MKSFVQFYPKLFDRLQTLPPFSSREEAATWLREAWYEIHMQAGASKDRLRILKNARICTEQGWVDVDKEVCYLDSPENPPLRLFLHADGSIILQQMLTARSEILFAKLGKAMEPTL